MNWKNLAVFPHGLSNYNWGYWDMQAASYVTMFSAKILVAIMAFERKEVFLWTTFEVAVVSNIAIFHV